MISESTPNAAFRGTKVPIEFSVQGVTVRGTKYVPDTPARPLPAVVLGHGWSMVAGGDLEDYAAVIAGRGLIAITFDFRRLGNSGGEPRQEIDPADQIEDFRCAISFARTCADVNADQIGVWGSSYSGGHALVVAAIDRRVKCVVSQVPTISGYQAGLRRAPHEQAVILRRTLEADREARFAGAEPGMIRTISADPDVPAAYPQQDSYNYMSAEGVRCPSWRNEVTLRSIELARAYEPGTYIRRIGPTPLLMIVADDDGLTPTDLQQGAFNEAHHPKELLLVPGGHYSVYTDHFSTTSTAAADWFAQHLSTPMDHNTDCQQGRDL
ncbi:alpha/beta hydrolase [Rhodococcus sp. IEGM 1379]|uniref:alpha/beta hydrolase n=1 Tax=Rhodococcus sp. IEGM 1379 TaxID=3047086 RepID=UPI0024B86BDC|nr:alpha/beta hydrolase [Rhodococcus sp. IEGM 1379]MDI9918296.1 alpha/beta hydrolase [Rhodococcus sp. IEGM 1379]